MEVIKLGSEFWAKLLIWGKERKIISPIEESILKVAASFETTGKTPSARQCNSLLKIKEKAYDEGYNL